MPQIDVCYSPELIHLYKLDNTIVVVVDIFRATSCMVTAFAHGVKGIIPVATVEECAALQAKGHLAGAERDAKKMEGFELDNSPFTYMQEAIKQQVIAVTTTNGTLALTKSKAAKKVLVGAFLNIQALATYLQSQPENVIVHCAGWKGLPNLEDTLFAGALAHYLKNTHEITEDAARMALESYQMHQGNLLQAVSTSSHVLRLARLGIQKDIAFCLEHGVYDAIPILNGEILQLLHNK